MALSHYSLSLNLLKSISLCPTGHCCAVSPPPYTYSVGFLDYIVKSDTDLLKFHHVALNSFLRPVEIT